LAIFRGSVVQTHNTDIFGPGSVGIEYNLTIPVSDRVNNREGSAGWKTTLTTAPSVALNQIPASDLKPSHLRDFFRFVESVVFAPPYPKNMCPDAVAQAMTPVDEIETARAKGGERDMVSFESEGGMGGCRSRCERRVPVRQSK